MSSKISDRKRAFLVFSIIAAFVIAAACTSTTKTATRNTATEVEEVLEQKSREELEREMIIAFNLGYDRYQQRDYESSLPYLHKTHELDKEINSGKLRYPRIGLQIGRAYFERGIIDSAYYAYYEGLQYNPGNLTFLNWLQWYYLSENKIDDYIDVTDEILKYEKDLSKQKEHLVRMKDILISRQEYEKALEKIELLMTLDPHDAELDNERIGMIREIGGEEALLKEFEKKYQQDPNDTEVLWQLITAYSDQSEYERVMDLVDRYISLRPDDLDARLRKVAALRATNKFDKAIAALKKIITLQSGEPKFLVEIADIYHVDKKDLRTSIQWAFRARQINHNFGEANYMIAELIIEYIDVIMDKYGRTTPSYDDKLIYEIAVTYYKDAAKDPNTKVQAERYVTFYGENFMRTSEDKFMHKGYNSPRLTEYEWVWKYKM